MKCSGWLIGMIGTIYARGALRVARAFSGCVLRVLRVLRVSCCVVP